MGCNCKNKKKNKVVGSLPDKVQKMKIFKVGYIKSFLRFLWSNILSGFKQVTHEQYYDRLAICRGCPFLDHESLRCTDCGCFIKVKAKFKTEDCPQNYWEKLREEDKEDILGNKVNQNKLGEPTAQFIPGNDEFNRKQLEGMEALRMKSQGPIPILPNPNCKKKAE